MKEDWWEMFSTLANSRFFFKLNKEASLLCVHWLDSFIWFNIDINLAQCFCKHILYHANPINTQFDEDGGASVEA